MSVSNTSDVPMLAGGYIDMEMIQRQSYAKFRRTKIICTIGPACWDLPQLEEMAGTGMDVARLNFSHGNHQQHGAVLERLRQAAKNQQRHIATLLDTKGPEIRSGFFDESVVDGKLELIKGQTLILTTDYSFKGNKTKLACSYSSMPTSVKPGQSILVADGSLVLTVQGCDVSAGEVTCRVENTATIGERKNMNLPGVKVDLPTFTEKDIDDIVNFGIKNRVDFIAASFVRKGSDVLNLRKLLNDNGGQFIKIICKIENQEGLENYDEILKLTDAIMVARGDLGMEIPPSKVFLAQKYMIRKANIAGKPVITATQMLESMVNNPRPTRAECSDVANAVFDGTDAVMLSGETANGAYFAAAIKTMARTTSEAENARNYNALYQSVCNSVLNEHGRLSPAESLASSAVKTAIDVHAAFIMVLSETGATARYLAKFRPGRLIVCLTLDPVVARQTNGLLRCVRSFVVDSLADSHSLALQVGNQALKAGLCIAGDSMVVVAGHNSDEHGKGSNNMVRVETVERNYDVNEPATLQLGAKKAASQEEEEVVGHLRAGFHLPKNKRYSIMAKPELDTKRQSLMHLNVEDTD